MHTLTFYPIGNADCCCIDLQNGKEILIDFADKKDPYDESDLRCDLPALLREHLDQMGRDSFDIVAFSHLDDDHYRGMSDFFWLDHAKKYQGDDRIKIKTLWVPSAIITETSVEDEEAKVLQSEARYRFKEGRSIRVFSRPEKLIQWCQENHISIEDRYDLITDAGQVVPDFSLISDDVEFFVHSPFAIRKGETEVEDRNESSLVFQATFRVDGVDTKALLFADTTHENLSYIVLITNNIKRRPERLEWDVAKLPHHCSYLSLGPEKGIDKTEPMPNIDWLWSEKGNKHAIIVSTSKPIPSKGSEADNDRNPPHRQAASYYRDVIKDLDGEFAVTMEHPTENFPEPLVIEIDSSKSTLKKGIFGAGIAASHRRTPRAG